MSKEAKEFLDDNGYDFHNDDLYIIDDSDGGVYAIDVDILDVMDQYFAFRLGKLILEGKVKTVDG